MFRFVRALAAGALVAGPFAGPAATSWPGAAIGRGRAAAAGAAAPASALSAGPVAYRPPLRPPLRMVRGFDPPENPYGPGHLGVDLAAWGGGPVVAAGPGVVTFAGPVAGRGVVVVEHADGVRTEYEPVRPLVHRGAVVAAGTPIGVLAGRHRGCPVRDCLHWGARRGDTYLDPLTLLAPLGPVRLLPWDP